MEIAYESHLLARVLLTVATLGYGLVTMKADFNATHATNPLWTPHARFHVVWQVLSYSGVGLIALGLIWIGGPMQTERLYLAGLLGVAMYGAFFAALFSRPVYGGLLYDDNGYPPFKAPVGPGKWDVNVTAFTLMTTFLVLGLIAI
ncbi:hypothetical protein ABMA32_20180 [Mesorhizobium sp. VNQ89]|uniref:hypothetical protein n=1 Tax=Mesorhizobium quangtriensis TaxID=3157709 RepID=UPI0032B724F9